MMICDVIFSQVTPLSRCSYPLAFLWFLWFLWCCCSWMRPLGALCAVSFARFRGGGGGGGGRRRRGACAIGGRHGGWRVRRSTVWQGWRRRRRLLLLLHRRRGIICEKRLKGHGGSLVVFLLLLGWRVLRHPQPPWKHRGRKKSYKRFSESWEFYIWHIQDGEAFQTTLSPLVALGKGCSSQLPWQLFSWHLLIVWLIKSKAQGDSKPKHTQFTVKCVQGKQKSSHLRVKAANNCLSLTSTNTFAVMDRNSLK